jgi:hypothetical protein
VSCPKSTLTGLSPNGSAVPSNSVAWEVVVQFSRPETKPLGRLIPIGDQVAARLYQAMRIDTLSRYLGPIDARKNARAVSQLKERFLAALQKPIAGLIFRRTKPLGRPNDLAAELQAVANLAVLDELAKGPRAFRGRDNFTHWFTFVIASRGIEAALNDGQTRTLYAKPSHYAAGITHPKNANDKEPEGDGTTIRAPRISTITYDEGATPEGLLAPEILFANAEARARLHQIIEEISPLKTSQRREILKGILAGKSDETLKEELELGRTRFDYLKRSAIDQFKRTWVAAFGESSLQIFGNRV